MDPSEWEKATQDIVAAGGDSAPGGDTSAFTVEIGEFQMNKISKPYPPEGSENSGLGQPNPTRISWSKENIVKTHEIPWPKHKTARTSKLTLWKLDLEFQILDSSHMKTIQDLVDKCGPYKVKTYFKSMDMYILSFTAVAQEGRADAIQDCSMKLIELND